MHRSTLLRSVILFAGVFLIPSGHSSPPPHTNTQLQLQKEERLILEQSSCSRLQHEAQKAIMSHKWGLDNLKFQQRLKRHPKYIVTIQHVKSVHEPIVELRCHKSSLRFLFHEARFTAESVRLFDIHSIFPIHSGSLSIKLNLDNLVVALDRGSDIGLSVSDLFFDEDPANVSASGKEHREGQEDNLLDLEKEIETVFLKRIQPDVQNQIKKLLAATVKHFLHSNLVTF